MKKIEMLLSVFLIPDILSGSNKSSENDEKVKVKSFSVAKAVSYMLK